MATNEGITDVDLQLLLSQNILAAEQLRRIVAERLVAELKAEKEQSQNGTGEPQSLSPAATISES